MAAMEGGPRAKVKWNLFNKVLQTSANVARIMDAFIDEINWYFIVRCPFSD